MRAGGVRDLHCEQRDVPVHSSDELGVARDDGCGGGPVPEQVAEREPAGIVPRHVLGHEGYRAVEIHEPHQVRVRIIDACVEDCDHDVTRAEEAGGPRLGCKHRPHVPLPRVELRGGGRRGRIGGREQVNHRAVGRGNVGPDVFIRRGGGHVGLHGSDVRGPRQLGSRAF